MDNRGVLVKFIGDEVPTYIYRSDLEKVEGIDYSFDKSRFLEIQS